MAGGGELDQPDGEKDNPITAGQVGMVAMTVQLSWTLIRPFQTFGLPSHQPDSSP